MISITDFTTIVFNFMPAIARLNSVLIKDFESFRNSMHHD